MHAINRGLFPFAVAMIALGIMQNRADAAPLTFGDLLISEVMANPSAVTDTDGEWFELYNTTSSSIDLDGWILRDDGFDFHTGESWWFRRPPPHFRGYTGLPAGGL